MTDWHPAMVALAIAIVIMLFAAAIMLILTLLAAPLGGLLWWTARRDYPWNWRLLVLAAPSYFRWLNTPQGRAAKERVRRT